MDDILLNIFWVVIGLVGLYYGAEWLVKGSAGLALLAGLSSLIVGLTVVAFGTSTPELIVCVEANLRGNSDIALGNIIGSNICNIGLVLGVAALITPFQVHAQFIRRELPILIAVSVIFVAMLLIDQTIGRVEGALLTTCIIIYTFVCIRIAKANPDDPIATTDEEFDIEELESPTSTDSRVYLKYFLLVLAGLGVLALGANRLVTGGKFLAEAMGVSEAVIALTVLAFGTSLPELATTIVACLRNEAELAVGNAIGSCLFNLLCVAGLTAVIKPVTAVDISNVDLGVMVGFAIVTLLLMKNRRTLSRSGGAFLVIGYLAYVIWLSVK